MLTWDETHHRASYVRFDKSHDKELGHNLKIARERAGFSQEDVADIIGINVRSIQRMEYGETSAQHYLTDFCQIYSCTYADLMPQAFRSLVNGHNSLLSNMDTGLLQSIMSMIGKELNSRDATAGIN